MVRSNSKASKKQNVNVCDGRKENSEIPQDSPIVSRAEADEDARLDGIEGEESIGKETITNESNTGKDDVCESSAVSGLTSDEEGEDDEVWDLIRVIPTAEEKIHCRYEHCSEQAVATWATDKNPEDKWSLCEKCQLEEFGGWPEGVDPIERSNDNCAASAEAATCTTARNDSTASPTKNTTNCTTLNRTDPSQDDSKIAPQKTTGEPVITQDESEDPQASEEKYELSAIVSLEKLRSSPIKCSDETCTLPACSVWTSTADPKKWYYCIDCQEKDFGGWPSSKELPCEYLQPEHLRAIATLCSKKRKPTMPVFTSKCVTPNPSLSPKGPTSIPEVVSGETKPSILNVSRAAVARHEKWQADAKKMGVNRIIVKKNEAKTVIFDALYDSFHPMSIDSIYMMLKKMIPHPVLKAALSDMSMDWRDDDIFDTNEEEDNGKVEKKRSETKDPFAGSVFFKAGRSAASSLYYVDHNRIKELNSEQKRELSENVANSNAEYKQLTLALNQLDSKTSRLLVEPTNDTLIQRLSAMEKEVSTLTKEVNDARALTINESHKNKLKRRIQSMAGHYRKRKQLCCSFLSSLEEISDGTISKKKCLKGDGQIALDSDETINKAAIAYAKSKNYSKAKKVSLADENFVGVALDSQRMVKRVYVDEE